MKKCTTFTLGKTTITKEYDNDPDTSHLGEYGGKLKPGCIIRSLDKFYEDLADGENIPHIPREYNFFYPPDNGEKIGTPEYKKYALQDYENMEGLSNSQWSFIGIVIKTEIKTDMGISDIVRSSLWGIEDHYDKNSRDYHKEVIGELIDEQKDALLEMGFSNNEIEDSLCNFIEVN